MWESKGIFKGNIINILREIFKKDNVFSEKEENDAQKDS